MKLLGLARLGPIRTQITILVFVTGIVSSGLVGLLLFILLPTEAAPAALQRSAARLAPIMQALDTVPRSERERLLGIYSSGELVVESPRSSFPASPQRGQDHVLWPLLARELPANTKIESITDEGSNRIAVAVQLSDGQHLVVRLRLEKPPAPTLVLLPSLVLFVALSTALSLWAGLRIVAPLSRFADAVDKFGLDGQEGPLAEEGPTEIRKATGAFNRMRERILRLIEDRTRMMMAISHDLRTPLTRLRLRAEDVSDPTSKRGILRDIDLMETSIAEAMSNLRDGGTQEPFELADLPSLVETICDQFSDAGVAVEYHGPDHLAGRVRPRALGRAITNLVENATKFGSTVVVRLSIAAQDTAQIEVEDDGPGIADTEKEAVLKPFYRTDAARQEAGGFGLGLAIAHEVARGHKGSLTLHDREPKGLRVRLRFPLGQEADANL